MIVVRKFLATLLWWAIFFIVFVLGLTAYILLQLDFSGDPQIVEANARAMSQDMAARLSPLMVFGTLAVAALGSIFGVLPLSRHHKRVTQHFE